MDTLAIVDDLKNIAAELNLAKEFFDGTLVVNSPLTGEEIARVQIDQISDLQHKAQLSTAAQAEWEQETAATRQEFMEFLAKKIEEHGAKLARIITYEGGRPPELAKGEIVDSTDSIRSSIKSMNIADGERDDLEPGTKSKVRKEKERDPVGVVALITPFNFPLAIANWNLASALPARNSVLWKPSEETPLSAIAYKRVFDEAVEQFNAAKGRQAVPKNILQVVIGEKEIGQALVNSDHINMVSATGSIGMGKAVKQATAGKANIKKEPLLELGGNNGVVITNHNDAPRLTRALRAVLTSVFGKTNQACTGTRRLIIHEDVYETAINFLKNEFAAFIKSGNIENPLIRENEHGYGPVIHQRASDNIDRALDQAVREGGILHFGQRMLRNRYPSAAYRAPALVEMPSQTDIMHEEVFGPVLFVTKYKDDIYQAMEILNAPVNARLVNGIYTQSPREVEAFKRTNKAAMGPINSPRGTGTPGEGLGFGAREESGEGEILDPQNLLGPFTLRAARRSAQYMSVPMMKE